MNEILLGEYEIPDASRLLEALEKVAIAFRVDELDERYKIRSKGAFGRHSRIRIWIDPADQESAQQIQTACLNIIV
ncbi:MAG: hypothetical protein AB7V14_12335 [Kiritimatiellia bacterium]